MPTEYQGRDWRAMRRSAGLEQQEVAERVKEHRAIISAIENERVAPIGALYDRMVGLLDTAVA